MTVTANKNDTAGATLDATTAAIQSVVNASAGLSTLAAAQLTLAQSQLSQVLHYMRVGRISAAGALTGLSLSAANLPGGLNAQKYGAQGSNIAARITALTSAAAGGQPYAFSQAIATQQLQAAQEELLLELIAVGKTTPALVLSTLS